MVHEPVDSTGGSDRERDNRQWEPIIRADSPELNAILGKPFPVLDDGFVRVVDYMGNDSAIVQAARVSYGAGTKTVRDDRGLIRYLMRNRHTSPFEQCELKLHVRVPMDCWRQWIRHRMASVNEYSTRYSEAIDSMQKTAPDAWRLQGAANRQGSGGFIPASAENINLPQMAPGGRVGCGLNLSSDESGFHKAARAIYERRLRVGVAREQARKDLPLSTYTEAYWKIDLHNLLHFLSLRLDPHAQLEIRQYATVIGDIVSMWVPRTWEAFLDFRLNAMCLSALEVEAIHELVQGRKVAIEEDVKGIKAKLDRLGITGSF